MSRNSVAQIRPIRLPEPLHAWLDAGARAQLDAAGAAHFNFTAPPGEPALTSADSVSWQVFKNPVALFVGGVSAVILELAEPRVRAGVWEHTSFRRDPVRRLQRTGLAAMVTVYGARSIAERMIAEVRRVHSRIEGQTAAGLAYRADDPELLRWVGATASFGFLAAYTAYVRPLSAADRDRFYGESGPAADLYGATNAPGTAEETTALFEATYPRLERSETVFEFLDLMSRAELLPALIRPVQGMLVRAAVEITPARVRRILGLNACHGLGAWEAAAVRRAGAVADRLMLSSSPPVQACLRLGLPPDYLFVTPREVTAARRAAS